ncbi:hypothetical protein EDB86DRAFT_3103002 [Lactarius hatsudake]|nr:hypothetical protein EDB86DRAFT_3103002 [Lactarius hatsudake]
MSGHAVADIRSTYGCSFIGLIISVMLFGITAVQTWIYYWQYGNRDSKSLRLFIAVIFLIGCLAHIPMHLFDILVPGPKFWQRRNSGPQYVGYERSDRRQRTRRLYGSTVCLLHWISDLRFVLMQRSYYARRVYMVGESIIIPIIIVIFGTTTFGKHFCRLLGGTFMTIFLRVVTALGFVFTVRATALKFWSRYTSLIPVTCIGMGSSVVADILITVSICWFLYHKRTGFARTDSVIMTLMTYSVHSGLLTSVLTCIVLISFATAPSAMYWQIFFWPMGKFYANSLLAMLNSRDYVRERSSADNRPDNAFDLSSIRIEQRSEGDKSRRPAVSVTVHRSATTDFPQGKRDHDVESSTVENSKLKGKGWHGTRRLRPARGTLYRILTAFSLQHSKRLEHGNWPSTGGASDGMNRASSLFSATTFWGNVYPSHPPTPMSTPRDPTAHHPLWLQATAAEREPSGRRRAKHTRRSTSTLMQVATDHAFTGTYVQRFRKNDPPENVSCPCGHALRDSDHIIRHCPRYTEDRISTAILSTAFASVHPLYPFPDLLSTRDGAERLLKFLDLTRALSKPESGPPLNVPPEPD